MGVKRDYSTERMPNMETYGFTVQHINAVDGPCKTMTKIPKTIILGYGMGDSCQISSIKNVNNLF